MFNAVKTPPHSLEAIVRQLRRRFLALLFGAYLLGALWPGLGLEVRGMRLGQVTFIGQRMTITPPLVILAVLLINAGLEVAPGELLGLAQ